MKFIDFIDDKLEHTHNPNITSSKFKIKDIFADHWSNFVKDNPDLNIRPVVFHEVERMMSCGSFSNGYSVYTCENNDCDNYLYVPFTCKSRFCSSCGVNYSLDRADTIAAKCINCNHRHITFTISDIIWPLFQENRSLLHLLFRAVENTLLSWFYELNKSESFIPGFVSTLHTFGRDLKWNPHIHTLITEGACR